MVGQCREREIQNVRYNCLDLEYRDEEGGIRSDSWVSDFSKLGGWVMVPSPGRSTTGMGKRAGVQFAKY